MNVEPIPSSVQPSGQSSTSEAEKNLAFKDTSSEPTKAQPSHQGLQSQQSQQFQQEQQGGEKEFTSAEAVKPAAEQGSLGQESSQRKSFEATSGLGDTGSSSLGKDIGSKQSQSASSEATPLLSQQQAQQPSQLSSSESSQGQQRTSATQGSGAQEISGPREDLPTEPSKASTGEIGSAQGITAGAGSSAAGGSAGAEAGAGKQQPASMVDTLNERIENTMIGVRDDLSQREKELKGIYADTVGSASAKLKGFMPKSDPSKPSTSEVAKSKIDEGKSFMKGLFS